MISFLLNLLFRASFIFLFLIGLASSNMLLAQSRLTVRLFIEGLHMGNGLLSSPIQVSGLSPDLSHSDSIDVYLASNIQPYSFEYTARALLFTNGIAVANLPSAVIGQSYYIVLKHRNAIEIWSKIPVIFSSNTYYNFTSLHQFPAVNTSPIVITNSNSAVSGGTISIDGGSTVLARGVCWSTLPNPTIDLPTKTINGSGSGSFTANITSLSANTTYYVRAFATNGVGTAYGDQISFTTTLNVLIDVDGNIYDSVVIGTQVWMKQNLKVSRYRNGALIPTGLSDTSWQNTTSGAYAIYNNDSYNDSIYGKLYNWYAVADPRGLCPSGWHVPSDREWTTLENFLGGSSVAGGKIKSVEITGSGGWWMPPNEGASNSSGFTGLPAGTRLYDGNHNYIGSDAYWWSSTLTSTNSAWIRYSSSSFASLDKFNNSLGPGYSVRCLKNSAPHVNTSSAASINSTSAICSNNVVDAGGDSILVRGLVWSTFPDPTIALPTKTISGAGSGSFTSNLTGLQPSTTYYVRAYATNNLGVSYGNQISFTTLTQDTVIDIDGNAYDIFNLGAKTWMKQNLKTSKYRNGDPIPNIVNKSNWQNTTSGAFVQYDNSILNDIKYGKLYNWYAVKDPRGLCPTGWHVPSDLDWQTLESALGMPASELATISGRGETQNVGGQMKDTGVVGIGGLWNAPNSGATNSSGFTGLPGGFRGNSSTFGFIGTTGFWWSSSEYSASNALYRYLGSDVTSIWRAYNPKYRGHSVRCVKNTGPSLNSSSVTGVTTNGAVCGGIVTDLGGDSVNVRGVVWSILPNPTVSLGTKTTDGSGIGSFISFLSGLQPGTTYYVRAYASNGSGTSYGNEITFVTLNVGQFTDLDGNVYDTLVFGSQVWMKQNLKVTKYRNGDAIPSGLSNTSWQNTTGGAYAIYDNDASNDQVFGKLYNWYAVVDPRGLCPTNWHVPGDAEWQILEATLGVSANELYKVGFRGSAQNVGGKMKGVSSLWISPNTGANDSSGFTGLPGGIRFNNGTLSNIGKNGYWWSSTQAPITSAWSRLLSNDLAEIFRSTSLASEGRSVRCVMDVLPIITTSSVTATTQNGITCGGNVSNSGSDAVTTRGVVWDISPNPTIALSTKTTDGSGIGNFTSTIMGLSLGTTYYIRAYATNGLGTAYGNEIIYTMPNLPSVSTTAIGSIMISSAVSGGTVNNDGGAALVARGVCWSTYPNPDTSLNTKTFNGNGIGIYSSALSSLMPNTKYYVRAYAVNSVGVSYGNQISFTTPYGPPEDINGNIYQTVTIGDQVWFKENLKVTKYNNGDDIINSPSGSIWASTTSGAFMSNPNQTTCSTNLGLFYNFYAVADNRGLCPVGWHVPRDAEWKILETNLGMPSSELDIVITPRGSNQSVGSKLKTQGIDNPIINQTTGSCSGCCGGWDWGGQVPADWSNFNQSGFSALSTSYISVLGNFEILGSAYPAGWWTSTAFSWNGAFMRKLDNSNGVIRDIPDKHNGFAVRCLRNETVTDIDGNVYNTVIIGNQEWMSENLKVSKYRNGDAIPSNITNAQWQNITSGAYAVFNNDISNDQAFGKHYNWYAVSDPRGLCPSGWHVPTDAEWMTLENFLGGGSVAGGNLKAISNLWASPNTAATNSSGFSGLPGGNREALGGFYNVGFGGYWWSSTQDSPSSAWLQSMYAHLTNTYRFTHNKAQGFSVRCLRD